MLCQYGCGKEAKYPPGTTNNKKQKNKKWCCSNHYKLCPGFHQKNKILQKKILTEQQVLDRFLNSFEKENSKNLESILKSEQLYSILLEKECWIWKKLKDRDGYGVSNFNNYPIQAHRHSYKIFYGEIPNGKIVAHYCDTPECVNPNHLFLATHSENNNDRKLKGRSAFGLKNGMYTKPETRSYGNEKASSLWEVTFPEGHIKLVENLTKLCRENNISYNKVRNNKCGWKVKLLQRFCMRK